MNCLWWVLIIPMFIVNLCKLSPYLHFRFETCIIYTWQYILTWLHCINFVWDSAPLSWWIFIYFSLGGALYPYPLKNCMLPFKLCVAWFFLLGYCAMYQTPGFYLLLFLHSMLDNPILAFLLWSIYLLFISSLIVIFLDKSPLKSSIYIEVSKLVLMVSDITVAWNHLLFLFVFSATALGHTDCSLAAYSGSA